MMPKAKMVRCSSAPPENRLIREYRPCWSPVVARLRQKLTCLTLTFGVGMVEPRRKTARIASVKKIFLRRSGVRNALANAASTRASLSRDNPVRRAELLAPRHSRLLTRTGPTDFIKNRPRTPHRLDGPEEPFPENSL